MRRAVLLCASLALGAGCTPVGQPPQPGTPPGVPPGLSPDAACGAGGLQHLVGQPESVLATMRFGTVVRVIHPGDAVTEDYSPSRLDIEIDRAGRIATLTCG